MSRNYKFHNPEALYFVSFAVVNWLDVFTRLIKEAWERNAIESRTSGGYKGSKEAEKLVK